MLFLQPKSQTYAGVDTADTSLVSLYLVLSGLGSLAAAPPLQPSTPAPSVFAALTRQPSPQAESLARAAPTTSRSSFSGWQL